MYHHACMLNCMLSSCSLYRAHACMYILLYNPYSFGFRQPLIRLKNMFGIVNLDIYGGLVIGSDNIAIEF
jgi:hypothetical protein